MRIKCGGHSAYIRFNRAARICVQKQQKSAANQKGEKKAIKENERK